MTLDWKETLNKKMKERKKTVLLFVSSRKELLPASVCEPRFNVNARAVIKVCLLLAACAPLPICCAPRFAAVTPLTPLTPLTPPTTITKGSHKGRADRSSRPRVTVVSWSPFLLLLLLLAAAAYCRRLLLPLLLLTSYRPSYRPPSYRPAPAPAPAPPAPPVYAAPGAAGWAATRAMSSSNHPKP